MNHKVIPYSAIEAAKADGWEFPGGDALKACGDQFVVLRRKRGEEIEFMILCPTFLRGSLKMNRNRSISY